MYVAYGTFKHPVGEATAAVSRKAEFDKRGRRVTVLETWRITGYLQANDTAGVVTACAALERAYAQDFRDIGIYQDSGTSVEVRKSRSCLGGLRVIEPPTYPKGNGAELSTWREYQITLEGLVLAGSDPFLFGGPLDALDIMEWQEKVTLVGSGAPQFVIRPTLNGPPIKQQVRQQTAYRATQVGHAMGRFDFPPVPPPLFPGDEHEEQRQIERTNPEERNGELYKYGISWAYVFESVSPLQGLPHLQPA